MMRSERVLTRVVRVARAQLVMVALVVAAVTAIAALAVVIARVAENQTIDALSAGHDVPIGTRASPAVMLARAKFLLDHEAADDAQPLIQKISESDAHDIAVAALYDAGNARMRHALKLIEDSKFDAATADVVLAKDYYIRALRVDPDDWDAKVNLDIAMRLVRDFPDTMIPADDQRMQPKKLWTDLPGLPKGEP